MQNHSRLTASAVCTSVELNRLTVGSFGFVQMPDYLRVFYLTPIIMEKKYS